MESIYNNVNWWTDSVVCSSIALIQIVGEKQKLVIVNLQRTPLDRLADLRVFARCDDFTHLVMSKLSLAIPEFRLKR